MRKELAVPFAIGLGIILVAIAAVFYMQRGAHIQLQGSILKVRTMALDENSSLAVVDFRFANPADYPFVVHSCTVIVEDAKGNQTEGTSVTELDARRLFDYYPVLGKKYNDTLVMKDKIPAHESQDRMIAARFEIPESLLQARKGLLVRVEDVDGPVSDLAETKK